VSASVHPTGDRDRFTDVEGEVSCEHSRGGPPLVTGWDSGRHRGRVLVHLGGEPFAGPRAWSPARSSPRGTWSLGARARGDSRCHRTFAPSRTGQRVRRAVEGPLSSCEGSGVSSSRTRGHHHSNGGSLGSRSPGLLGSVIAWAQANPARYAAETPLLIPDGQIRATAKPMTAVKRRRSRPRDRLGTATCPPTNEASR
jgi:hypothetical protein